MKLAKLSLAAVLVAGFSASAFGADTLADAFAKGKVSGTLKAWYFDRDTGDVNNGTANKGNAGILNTGLMLGYVTDSLYGLSLGATLQGNYAPEASKEAKNLFAGDEFGSGAVLSEAYLNYVLGKTTVKIGRQFIATPLINGSPARFTKESYEGATVVNTDIPATTLIAGYISKFQGRTSEAVDKYDVTKGDIHAQYDSEIPNFEKIAVMTMGAGDYNAVGGKKAGKVFSFDGAYTAAVINKFIQGLTLTGQYVIVNDVAAVADVDLYYADASYVLPMSGYKLGFGLQHYGSKTGTALDAYNIEGHYTAGKVSISELAGFGASFAYGTTSKSDAVIAAVGNAGTGYTGMVTSSISASLEKDTDSYVFTATYDFANVGFAGLKALALYGVNKQHNIQIDKAYTTAGNISDITSTSLGGGFTYAVASVKGLVFDVKYEGIEKDTKSKGTKVDSTELRVMANYKF